MSTTVLPAKVIQQVFPHGLASADNGRIKCVILVDGYSRGLQDETHITVMDIVTMRYEFLPLSTLLPYFPQEFLLVDDATPAERCQYCNKLKQKGEVMRVRGCEIAGMPVCKSCRRNGHFIASCMVFSGDNKFNVSDFDDIPPDGTWVFASHSRVARVKDVGIMAVVVRHDSLSNLSTRGVVLKKDI